jgi:hypothetical protein
MLLEQFDNRKLSTQFLSSWELPKGAQDHSSGFMSDTNSLAKGKCDEIARVRCLSMKSNAVVSKHSHVWV